MFDRWCSCCASPRLSTVRTSGTLTPSSHIRTGLFTTQCITSSLFTQTVREAVLYGWLCRPGLIVCRCGRSPVIQPPAPKLWNAPAGAGSSCQHQATPTVWPANSRVCVQRRVLKRPTPIPAGPRRVCRERKRGCPFGELRNFYGCWSQLRFRGLSTKLASRCHKLALSKKQTLIAEVFRFECCQSHR